jgi:hypothetical protein
MATPGGEEITRLVCSSTRFRAIFARDLPLSLNNLIVVCLRKDDGMPLKHIKQYNLIVVLYFLSFI